MRDQPQQLPSPLKKLMRGRSVDKGDPQNAENQFFQLMKMVGVQGPYQTKTLILWCLLWYVTGTLLLGVPFLFLNADYHCSKPPPQGTTCQDYVCSLPKAQRVAFLDGSALKTLANEFGDYHCQMAFQISVATSLIYLGSLFGYIFVSLLIDNLGRKVAMLISFTIASLGMVLVASSVSLLMAEFGLFLAGFGSDSAINISFYFIAQTVSDRRREKQSTIIQLFFAIGGVTNILYYLVLSSWRPIFWLFFVGPSVLLIIVIFWYVEQVPQFLVTRNDPQVALKALLRIGRINGKTEEQLQIEGLTAQNLLKMKDQHAEKAYKSNQKYMTPVDLFKHRSIRKTSVCVCSLSFIIYFLYYGPLMLIDSFGFNVYVTALCLTGSEVIVYPICYFLIQRLERKKTGQMFFGAALVCSTLVMISREENGCQEECSTIFKLLQLLLIFAFRFCISFEFALFLIYCNELFPAQVRGLGIGISSVFGTVASTLTPVVIGALQRSGFPIMLPFIGVEVLAIIFSSFLVETKGQPLKECLDQFGREQQRQPKQSNENNRIELVEQN